MVSQTWWDFNHTFKMVLGNENDLALANENEGEGDGVVTPGLVDVGRFPPKNISELQSKLYYSQ